MEFYDNIYTLDTCVSFFNKPENYEEIKKEIVSVLKKNNLSLSQSASVFNGIIKSLGNTPINEL